MKFLDGYPELELLSRALSFTSASVRVSTRIEAYSCKTINREKRLFKTLEQDIKSDLELSTSISPPDQQTANLQSAFGPLNQSASRKTMWLLIATLNLAFPDHDFSRVNPEEFVKEDGARSVLNSLTSVLSNLRASSTGSAPGQLGGADAAFRASLFASYPPSMASLPGYNPLVPAGRSTGVNRRSKLSAAEKYGSSAPSSSTLSSRRAKEAGKSGRKVFGSPKNSSSSAASGSGSGRGSSSASYMSKLRTDLDGSGSEVPTHPFLRQVLEPIIELGECEVYSYTPDLESDPHAYVSDDDEAEEPVEEDEYGPISSYADEDEMMVMDRDEDGRGGYVYGDDDLGWEMDGVDSSSYPATPSGSIPPTPSGRPRIRKRPLHSFSASGSASGPGRGGFSLPNIALWDQPDSDNDDDDDDAGGLLWSSNYFMYNKKMRRILFISCWARKVGGASPVPMNMALPHVQHAHAPSFTSHAKPVSSSSDVKPSSSEASQARQYADTDTASSQQQHHRTPSREPSAVPNILSSYQPSKATASLIFGGGAAGGLRSASTPPAIRESSPATTTAGRGTIVNAAVSRAASPAMSNIEILNDRTHRSFEPPPQRADKRLKPISSSSSIKRRAASTGLGTSSSKDRKRRAMSSKGAYSRSSTE